MSVPVRNPSVGNLLRCLRVLAMTDEERLRIFRIDPGSSNLSQLHAEGRWFLEAVDDLAPALHERGWVEYADFHHEPGAVVVTEGRGDVRKLLITDLGRAQLNAAVVV